MTLGKLPNDTEPQFGTEVQCASTPRVGSLSLVPDGKPVQTGFSKRVPIGPRYWKMQMELWLQERLDLGTQTWHQESLSVSRESSFLCGGFIQVHILSL